MEQDILTTILAVEHEVRERLDAAGREAAEMVENLRRRLEEEGKREEELLAAALQQTVTAAAAEAQEQADAVVRAAAVQAEQLAGLDDETLERSVMKHLATIAPEEER